MNTYGVYGPVVRCTRGRKPYTCLVRGRTSLCFRAWLRKDPCLIPREGCCTQEQSALSQLLFAPDHAERRRWWLDQERSTLFALENCWVAPYVRNLHSVYVCMRPICICIYAYIITCLFRVATPCISCLPYMNYPRLICLLASCRFLID